MSPSDLRNSTLKTLRATRKDMASAGYRFRLRNKPADVQRDAALHAFDVESAIRALENEQLTSIRDDLIANEAALLTGIADLDKARANLAKVEAVIKAAGKALDIVAKVVAFAATRGLV